MWNYLIIFTYCLTFLSAGIIPFLGFRQLKLSHKGDWKKLVATHWYYFIPTAIVIVMTAFDFIFKKLL